MSQVLGDRIAIMSRGKLQCIGSSNFLKRTFGAGYKLIVSMQVLATGIGRRQQKLPLRKPCARGGTNPLLKELLSAPFFLTFGYLFHPRPQTQARAIEKEAAAAKTDLAMHPTVARLIDFVSGFVAGAALNAKESTANCLVVVLPFDQAPKFGAFFSALDGAHARLGVEGYGVTITSLEEV